MLVGAAAFVLSGILLRWEGADVAFRQYRRKQIAELRPYIPGEINGLLLQNILLITSSQLEFLVRNSRDGTHLGIGLFGWEKKQAQKVRSLLCEFLL